MCMRNSLRPSQTADGLTEQIERTLAHTSLDESVVKIHQLRAIVAIADTGSISAAARLCDLSPPAIAKAIKELESELRLPLLARATRGVVFTEAGKLLLAHARLITTQIRKSEEDMATLLGNRNTRLKIAVSSWIALSVLGETVGLFRKNFPDVQLAFHEALVTTVVPKLRDGSLDLAIGPSFPGQLGDEFERSTLFQTTSAVVCRMGHPKSAAQTLDELSDCEWLLSSDPREGAREEDPFKRFLCNFSPRIHLSSSYAIAIGLITGSDMLSLMPWPLVEVLMGREKLSVIPIQETLNPTDIGLATRRGDLLSASAQHFVDCFLKVMRNACESGDPGKRRFFHSFDSVSAWPTSVKATTSRPIGSASDAGDAEASAP